MKRRSSLRRTAAPIPVPLMACPPAIHSLKRGIALRQFPSRQCLLGSALFGSALFGSLRRRAAAAHGAGAGGNRLDDIVVAGAAADVAFQLLANSAVVEVIALTAHHIDRGHDHAGRAIAALQAVVLAERLLHWMQRTVRRSQTLNGEYVGAFQLQRQHGAGFHRLAVDVYDAGAALRRVAADMGAG